MRVNYQAFQEWLGREVRSQTTKRVLGALLCGAGVIGASSLASAATVTISGTSQSAITSAISSACNGSTPGTVIFPNGSYSVTSGFNVPTSCTLQAQNTGQATLNVTNNDYGIYLGGNNVTITGLVFNGGGIITTQTNTSTPQSNVVITNNVFQNIGSGKYGINTNGYWSKFNISYNQFSYISSISWSNVTSSTVVEGGTNYDGLGINNVNGMDQTTIDHNTFDHILGDAIHVMFNWTMGSASGTYTSANNNDISYNVFHDLHRMAIEIQGTSGSCPGGCNYSASSKIAGLTIKGNFNYHQYLPYYDEMGYSLVPDGSRNAQFLNNTAVYGDTANGCGGDSNAFENSGDGQLSQGNVLSSATSCASNWGQYFETGSISQGYLVTHQNNLLCGPTNNGANYFAWEGSNQHTGSANSGTTLDQYNYTNASCPNASDPSASTLALAFTSPNNQTVGNSATATWNVAATDEISVIYVQFFLDGSSTPFATQELQDLNTNFANDRKWLYHASINASNLNTGTHTIQAVATDVSGASQTVSQTFVVGSTGTPAASVTPASVSFGSTAVGIASGSQTVTLTDSGTAPLAINSLQIAGANASDFAYVSSCGSTVAAGSSCTVQLTFTPGAAGARTATLTISDNANPGTQTVSLTGTGTIVATPPTAPITALPTNLPAGMLVWLANNAGVTANGTAVSAWQDQSGNGYSAAQTNNSSQPTLVVGNNGQSAVHFNGTSSYLSFASLPISGNTGVSVFTVSASTQDPTAGWGFHPILCWPETSAWGQTFFGTYQTTASFRFGTTQSGNEPTVTLPFTRTDSFGLSEWIHSGTTDSMWLNGQSLGTFTGKQQQIAGIGNSAYLGYGANTFFAGDVSEVIVYARALSQSERQAIESYLMTKYHL